MFTYCPAPTASEVERPSSSDTAIPNPPKPLNSATIPEPPPRSLAPACAKSPCTLYFSCKNPWLRDEYAFVPPRRQPASNGPDPDATRSSLLRRLKNWDDHGGWQEFFDTYWKLIYAVAIKAGLSDAEAHDVVQESVVSVAKQMRADSYDRSKGTFKNWLFTITRRRIVDHLRRRKPEELLRRHRSDPGTSTSTDTLGGIADPASVELQAIWSEEWKKNLVDVAIERIKAQVSLKQFQIFDLYVLKDWPLRDVTRMLHVSATLVYVTKHRVNALIKREVRRLEQEFGKPEPGRT